MSGNLAPKRHAVTRYHWHGGYERPVQFVVTLDMGEMLDYRLIDEFTTLCEHLRPVQDAVAAMQAKIEGHPRQADRDAYLCALAGLPVGWESKL